MAHTKYTGKSGGTTVTVGGGSIPTGWRKITIAEKGKPLAQTIDTTVAGDSAWPTDHLKIELTRIFPELAQTRLSHSWFGYVAMHRDMIPRIFRKDGVVYATGYCGSGVVWARWLGMKAAQQMLGNEEAGKTAFDFRPPRCIPFFNGSPWFMPLVYAKMKASDRRLMRGRDAGKN